MKIHETRTVKYAIVETSVGTFKVHSEYLIERWHESIENYSWFDENHYEPDDIKSIRMAGLDALKVDI